MTPDPAIVDHFHHRLTGAEKRLERLINNAAPTVPKYDITGKPGGLSSVITVSEIGWGSATTLSDTLTVPVQYQDVLPTDMIWVMAMAPSINASGQPAHYADSITDTAGNTYDLKRVWFLETSPAGVNTGVLVAFYATDPTSPMSGLDIGTDSITAHWSGNVYDRYLSSWLIRFSNGPTEIPPIQMVSTPDNDAATYAASQVALSIPSGTSGADGSLLFGNIITVRAAGAPSIAYGGVGGYNGFVEVRIHDFASTRQSYSHHMQTAFANAILINSSLNPVYEIDQGLLNDGDSVTPFNGLGQAYSFLSGGSFVPATNFWKGGIVHLITN